MGVVREPAQLGLTAASGTVTVEAAEAGAHGLEHHEIITWYPIGKNGSGMPDGNVLVGRRHYTGGPWATRPMMVRNDSKTGKPAAYCLWSHTPIEVSGGRFDAPWTHWAPMPKGPPT